MDIRVDVNFFKHPKTIKLERQCGLDGIKCLLILWMWAASNRPEGDLKGINEEDIELVAEWRGEKGALLAALTGLRWLDAADGQYSLHNWADRNAWVASSVTRGDKARLSRMARSYPELYAQLRADGAQGITRAEYLRLTKSYDRSTIINGALTNVERPLNERKANVERPLNERKANVNDTSTKSTTPAPAPSPSPPPSPSPKPSYKELPDVLSTYRRFPGYRAAKEDIEQLWVENLHKVAPSTNLGEELKAALKWIKRKGIVVEDARGFITDWLKRKQASIEKDRKL